jgi:hypothetical protein
MIDSRRMSGACSTHKRGVGGIHTELETLKERENIEDADERLI